MQETTSNVRKKGNSLILLFPKDLVRKEDIKEGDKLTILFRKLDKNKKM